MKYEEILRSRIKALCIDFFCGFLVVSIVVQVLVSLIYPANMPVSSEMMSGLGIVALMFFYWVITPFVVNGQTFGKWIFGIRIISLRSDRLKIWQLTIRTISYLGTCLKIFQIRDLSFNLVQPFYHDVTAGTNVIYKV